MQGRLQYDEFYALKDVSLDIMPGDFYGLVGLNGSGKSTLLKTIAGVYKPSKGKVTVNGTIAPLIEPVSYTHLDVYKRQEFCRPAGHPLWHGKLLEGAAGSRRRAPGTGHAAGGGAAVPPQNGAGTGGSLSLIHI